MNAPHLTIANAPLGTLIAAGILAGRFFLEEKPYAIIVAPKHEGEFPATAWNKSLKAVDGALSDFDGLANTRAMAEAASPLAVKTLALRIGEVDDWYLPSRGELLLAWSAREAMPEGEKFEKDIYWTSTQYAGDRSYAWYQGFLNGTQNYWHKDDLLMARAVRRVAI